MSDETTTDTLAEIEGQGDTVQVREGRWRTRRGDIKNIRPCEPLKGAYYVWPWTDGCMTFQDNGRHRAAVSDNDLVEYLGPIEPDKTQELPDKTQELETKTQELPEYRPPEGWRLVRFGELLLPGDEIVQIDDGRRYPTHRIGDAVGPNQQYIRRIKPQPQPEPQPEPQPRPAEYRPPEGWRVLAVGEVLREGDVTVRADGYQYPTERVGSVVGANQRYIRPIEPEPQPEPVPEPQAATIEELRSEVSYVQRLLGESNRKVTQLEELVGSLRNINDAQEKAFEAAGKENTDLQHRLNVVATEWAEQAETIRRLQIELDAAQQVPADSPELRQLRADLEQVTRERDEYRYAHDVLVKDANTVHERTKAMTVEAIAEWLEPIRAVDNPNLANETLQHLPQIMRSLTGLESPEDVD